MILFDYIYYLFAKLYKKSKEERETNSWKISGKAVVEGTFAIFLITIGFLFSYIFNYKHLINPISGILIFLFSFSLFYIRYKKRITFEDVQLRIESLNIKQMILLRIITFIYLLIAIPGCFFAAIYFGKTVQG